MSKVFRIGIVGLLVVGALAVAMTGTALAQEETPTPAPAPFYGHGFARGLGGEVGLEAAAEALGMTADELSAQLWGGVTLADLVEVAGVDLQDLQNAVQDAVTAARDAAMRDSIEQAVEDGNLTRGHADWLLEGLDNGYLGGHGFGMRGGFGRHGGSAGPGGFGMSRGFRNAAPATSGTKL